MANDSTTLDSLVLERETVRSLTPTGIELVGKKKTKGDRKTCVWPECGDTTKAKPECPIITHPGETETPGG